MAFFSTNKILYGAQPLISTIATHIKEVFQNDGYEVKVDELSSGAYDISISKGGIFKAILGMKTALKVSLIPRSHDIYFEAGVGIWGQQAIPTIISSFFFGPILLTQISGMVEQAKLDDKALQIAEEVIRVNASCVIAASEISSGNKFCTSCGSKNSASAKFCSACGKEIL